MGGLLNRSSGHGDGRKMKEKKDKRKQPYDASYASDIYFMQDGYENEETDGDVMSTYEIWENKFDRQQMMNMNDPPGAPSTFSSNYPIPQNMIMVQSWPSPHDTNNSFYSVNSHQMTYNPNQFTHVQFPNTIDNQPQPIKLQERPSKKVQFSPACQLQERSSLKSLPNTQSLHKTNDVSISPPTKKPLPSSNKLSAPLSTAVVAPSTSSVQKPIYVSIDYKATLAERSQTVPNKSQRKIVERSRSNDLNSPKDHHRSQSQTSQTSHRDKKPKSIIKSPESSRSKSSNSQRPLTRSTSTNALTQNVEKISKSDENHRRHRRNHRDLQHVSNGSPARRAFSPHKPSNVPMMRIPLSQHNRHHQRQPIILSGPTSTTSLSRI